MKQQNFEQEIIQTLELCLSKMSQKLKSSFNPMEKLSIQLLQQFRSTISTYHTCQKRAGKVLDNTNKTTQNSKPNKPTRHHKQSDRQSYLKQSIINKEKEIACLLKQQKNNYQNPPVPSFTQPSGLLMTPV